MSQEYWEKDLETLPQKELQDLQLKRLKVTLGFALQSDYYKNLFRDKKLSIDSFNHFSNFSFSWLSILPVILSPKLTRARG